MMDLMQAPPSPSPTPVVSVTPSVSVSPSPSMTKLPVTGSSEGHTWGVLGVGVLLVVLGAVLVTWVRARHARD